MVKKVNIWEIWVLGEVQLSSVQLLSPTLSSVAQSCDPMDCSTPGFPVCASSWNLLKLMSIESVMLGEGQIGIPHTVSSQVFC